MPQVTAALLGVEHPHSLAHLRTLQALPEVESIVVWDENPQALAEAQAAQPAKIVAATTDLDAVLAREDVFFVLTAVPNDQSPALVERAARAGRHILAEKPIGRTAAEVERAVRAAEDAGVTLSVCYQNRLNPAAQAARDMVAQGLLGPVVSLEGRMVTTGVRFRDPRHWLFSHDQAGGGILSWLGCHYLDLMRFVTGDEVVAVSAEAATLSGEAIDVEDVITLALRFRSGAVASFHAGYMLTLSGGGYMASGYDSYLGIRGLAGRVAWEPTAKPPRLLAESSTAAWYGAPRREFVYDLRDTPSYGGGIGEDFVRAFLRAAQGYGAPPTTGYDAWQVARIVEAAYQSSREGQRVTLTQE